MRTGNADIVVIEFSGNCFACPVPYGSERVLPAVVGQPPRRSSPRRRASASTWCWCSRRRCVPTSPGPTCNAKLGRPGLQPRALTRRTRRSRTGRKRWSTPTATTNKCCSYPDLFGEATLHTVRADDGVHLTQDGARRTAEWTAAALRQFWTGRRSLQVEVLTRGGDDVVLPLLGQPLHAYVGNVGSDAGSAGNALHRLRRVEERLLRLGEVPGDVALARR